jgi:membrane protease YdiL (CAAX protease family)
MHPALTPDAAGTADQYRDFIGSERIRGNWGPAAATLVGNQLSITAEELYWRGMMMPRMELGIGKGAWAVQGLLWAPSHVFKYWEILPLFAATLPLSALAQKTKNSTVVYVTHTAINVITGVAGVFAVTATGFPESPQGASQARRRYQGRQRIQLLQIQGRF